MARKPQLMRRRLPAGAMLAILAIAGCREERSTSVPPVTPPRGPAPIQVSSDPWVFSTDRWDAQSRGAYLGNGRMGQRFMQSGLGLSGTTPEPAYRAGLYEREALVTLPPLLPVQLSVNGKLFGADPAAIKKYHQELRVRDGVLATTATWDAGSGPVELEIQCAVLRQKPDGAAALLHVRNGGKTPVQVQTSPQTPGHGIGYQLRLFALGTAGKPKPEEGQPSSAGASVAPGADASFAVPADVYQGPERPEYPPLQAGLSTADLEAHKKAWQQLWGSDIEIEGDPEAQQVVRACLFYLLCSIRPDSTAGVPPTGLSNNSFSGHVFWDMDSWMLPAVLPLHPDLARAMLEYRVRTLPGAKANAKAEGKPGASYAWESGATGKETLGPDAIYRNGRHVTGDVALAMRQYYRTTGDRDWLRTHAWPVLQATADYWVARAEPDGHGGFVIRKVTTPDENAGLVDQSAWTQYVARTNLEFAVEAAATLGQPANPRWNSTAQGLGYLRDPKTKLILSYAGFKETTKAKQADALLLAFPGEAKLPEEELGKMYDFYAPRVIATGPAMTDAIHALVAARLGRTDEALRRFRESYRPFVRPPFHLFSEKRTKDNVCFLTGASGVVEAVLYGFAGIRLDSDGANGRPRIEPHLPAEWKAVRIRNLQWRGKAWDVEIRPGAPPAWSPHKA